MKFPRFYNPFRRIRDLESSLSRSEADAGYVRSRRDFWQRSYSDVNNQLHATRADLADAREEIQSSDALARTLLGAADSEIAVLRKALGAYDQAIEAFMVERYELKADLSDTEEYVDAIEAINRNLRMNVQVRDLAGLQLTQTLIETQAELEDLQGAAQIALAAISDQEEIISDQAEDLQEANAALEIVRAQADRAVNLIEMMDKALQEQAGTINALGAETVQQATEITETISYVKAAEASLAAVGISIYDGANGPAVACDEQKFLAGLNGGLVVPTDAKAA